MLVCKSTRDSSLVVGGNMQRGIKSREEGWEEEGNAVG